MLKQPKIFVFLPTATFLHREMLEGILSYAHSNGPWRFHLELEDFNRQPLNRIRYWGCTGIIALVKSGKEANRLSRTGLPTVFLGASTNLPNPARTDNVVIVQRDEEAVGKAAADYFMKRGFDSFAYVGTSESTAWSMRRELGYRMRLRECGLDCVTFPKLGGDVPEDYANESRRLLKWLAALPYKTAIFVVHDRRAQQVLSCALEARLSIPNDIAVLGVDNDTLLCETAAPSISSISLNGHGTGQIAAELLDGLMRHELGPCVVNPVKPEVITRESTDLSAVYDPVLSRALSLLEKDFAKPFDMGNFCAKLKCSKRTLEMKIQRHLGTTITRHLLELRLSAARRMLSTTKMTVAEIAAKTGFCSASHLGARLLSVTGNTTRHYRPGQNG